MTGPTLGRAPWVTAGDLDDDQRTLAERIALDWGCGAVGVSPVDGAGRLVGPFDLMAASPAVGRAVLDAAGSFRHAELALVDREVAILVVAVAEGARFMWEGHHPIALAAGLDPGAAQVVEAGGTPQLEEPTRTVHRVARALVTDGDLDDALFDEAVGRLGWRELQEIVWLVGLYRALGLAMRVARTPAPGIVDASGEGGAAHE